MQNKGNLFSFPCFCVGYELSFRAVASQVLSALQSLTSVFGMGTGGPFALKTLTSMNICPLKTEQSEIGELESETQVIKIVLNIIVQAFGLLVSVS